MLHSDGAPVGPELRALALMNLGNVETWTFRLEDAETHLTQGLALGREIGRPYLELGCLGALGAVANMITVSGSPRTCSAKRSQSRSVWAGRRTRSSASPTRRSAPC